VDIRLAARKILKSLLRIFAVAVFAIVMLLLFFQHRLIYHPHPYDRPVGQRGEGIVPIAYTTSQGRQQSYYLPPRGQPMRRLWVCFPGNGSLAMDWLRFLKPAPDSHDGFLLIDYPGYGDCEGSASPAAIEDSAEAAFASLAVKLNMPEASLEKDLGVLGLSLGCATGLNFAVRHPVDRVILLAPFTRMRDMARRMVGWPLCLLLRHNFDNGARLSELAARASPPRVTIFHGDADTTIPISMGRQLAALYPEMITFHAVPGAGHNSVLTLCLSELAERMRE
jgi:pimeloyl-ACP methyl ester carboxylesterase